MQKVKLSLIVPCYNEEGNVRPFFERAKAALDEFVPGFETVFIDDGSTDGTLVELMRLYKENPGVRVISFSRNFGKEAAMLAGLSAVQGEYTAIIDADLQQDPALVRKMVEELENDPTLDIVGAYQENREESKTMAFFKKGFYMAVNAACKRSFRADASDFRTMRRSVVDAILSLPEKNRFTKGIFSWVGFNAKYIPYTVSLRFSGKSKWSTRSLLRYALGGIFSFSDLAFRFLYGVFAAELVAALLCALILPLAGAGAVLSVLVPLGLFLFAVTTLCLAFLGTYLARVYDEVRCRPDYVVRYDFEPRQEENA